MSSQGQEPLNITPEILRRVYFDNVSNHQIGGIVDGWSTDTAQDIGFESREETLAIIDELKRGNPTVPAEAGRLTVAQMNANEQEARARHERIRGEERRFAAGLRRSMGND